MTTRAKGTRDTAGKVPVRGREAGSARPLPAWLPLVVYALLVIVLFRAFIFSDQMLFGTDTLALGYFARDFYRNFILSHHHFPLWDPYLFGGLPFVDGMHGDIFYPTTVLLFLMKTSRALGWRLIVHIFLAGIFTYGWLRQIGARRSGAFFGGMVYMLGAHLVSLIYPGGDGKIFNATLMPLLFWLTERAAARRSYADFVFLALGVSLMIYTSHMQVAYFAIWGFSLYFFFRVYQLWRAERNARAVVRLLALFALSGLIGAAASAAQLVPPYVYLNHSSHRAEKTVEAGGARGYDYSTSWSLHPEEALSLIVPEFSGTSVSTPTSPENTYWGRNPFKLNSEYAGFVPLLLIPFVFFRRRRNGRAWFFTGLGILALIYALGDTTPFFHVFYALVPGVKLFRAPSTIIPLYALMVATLGGLGLDAFLARGEEEAGGREGVGGTGWKYLWIAAAVFLVLALAASGGALARAWVATVYRGITPDKMRALQADLPSMSAGFWITFALCVSVAGIWEMLRRGLLGRRAAFGVVAVLALLDVWRVDPQFIQVMDAQSVFGADDVVGYLQQQQAKGQVFRVLDAGAYGQTPDYLADHGIEQMAGHHGNEMARYRDLIGGTELQNVSASHLRLLDLLNVEYLVAPQAVRLPAGYTEAYHGSQAVVYRNENALPRAFLADAVQVVPDSEAVARLISPAFDFRDTALLAMQPPAGLTLPAPAQGGGAGLAAAAAPPGTVHWRDHGLNEQSLDVSAARPALLVITENWYGAWKATVDGAPAPVLRADYSFRGIPVPAGKHVVTLRYDSPLLATSVRVSVVVLGALALLALASWLRPTGWLARERR